MLLKLVALCCALVATQAAVPEDLDQDDIDAFIHEHNRVRTDAGVGSLTWNQTLSDYAASWVSQCQFRSSNGPYGENVFGSAGSWLDNADIAKASVRTWEAEKVYVDNPDYYDETFGYYLQVVWEGNESVGCAIIQCDPAITGGLRVYVVCEYSPGGDYKGLFL